jgi:hypothetical protein
VPGLTQDYDFTVRLRETVPFRLFVAVVAVKLVAPLAVGLALGWML